MIVRIAGEGQYEVDDADARRLKRARQRCRAGAGGRRRGNLPVEPDTLLAEVRKTGTAIPEDDIVPSDLLLPHAEATLDEVRDLLGEEGLIPG